ncbi:hypothetical protein D3C72_1901330 [compost metagenome]
MAISSGPAFWIHLLARTSALASAWVVLGLASMNACGAYRQPAGMLPPKMSWVSLSVRVSTMIWISPGISSIETTGSVLEMASIWPLRTAVTAPAPAPTPMKETSDAFRPCLARKKLTTMLVDEPGAVTPIFLPFRSAALL